MRKYLTALLFVIITVGAVVMGLWLFGYYVRQVWLAQRSKQWPSTTGRITSSSICKHYTRGGYSYYPCLKYQYSVNGEAFKGDAITLAHKDPGSLNDAEAVARKYEVGNEVEVFYDQSSPDIACLEPGVIPWEVYIPIAAGPVLAVIGLVLLWVNLPELRRVLWRKRLGFL
jgi:hypothetical protein